jgi:hypothetical protein
MDMGFQQIWFWFSSDKLKRVCFCTRTNNRAGVKPSDPMCLRKVQIVQKNDGMAVLKWGLIVEFIGVG